MLKNRKAFTLIELLVVVGIIGFLVAGGMMAYTRAKVKARDTKRVSDVSEMVKVLALYESEEGVFPVAITDTCINGEDTITEVLLAKNVMSHALKDPLYEVDSSYCYLYSTDTIGLSYTIKYKLESDSDAGDKGDNVLHNE